MKNQIKKSLSLFMAVMMLLSCWVWVAPEKASADHTTGQYYVKYIVSNISEAGNNGKWSGNSMTINYTKNDGTKGTKSISLTKSNYTSTGTNKVIWEGYVDGFPNSIGWYMKMEWKAAASVYLNVRGAYFLVGKDAASCTNSVTSRDNEGGADCFKWQNNATGSGTKEATFTIYANSGDPYIASADVLSATTLDCPAWGTTTVNSTTAVQPTYWDQYGVKWLGAVDTTYFITDTATGTEDKGGQDKGIWTELNGKKGFVKINASMQENIMADENGKKDLYMIASATNSNGDEVNASQKITVSYSKVKYTFNANGSISGLGAKIYETKDKTKELGKDGTYAAEAYYGKEAIFPKNDSVFAGDGYTFLGFWTKAQPSTGDAYYYSKEADFAYPCTSAEYAGYKTMTGAIEKDGVVTVAIEGEAKKFYDAGEKWDDKTKTVNGNKTYYGWWCSKDINIKFYDLDGKYLGADTVKYGQKGDAISWPKSDYTDKVFVSGAVSVKASAGKWVNKDGEAVSADNSYEFKHDLILTPATTAYNFDNAYTIVFMSEAGGELSKEEDYGYRATVTVPANREVPNAISSDPQFGYTFVGWTTVKPSKGNYHILLENSDFDDNGTAIPLVNDWIVRSDATYYPVYRKALKSYNVKFVYRDATGVTVTKTIQVAYGSEIIPPVDDVPSKYATGGYEYSFLKWLYKNGENKDTESTYAQEITLSSENVNIPANALVGKNGAIVFQATYPESGTPTPYTVTFRSRNENGGVITQYFEVNHGDEITDDVVAKLAPATEYDNGEALVSFMNKWTVIEGAAGKEDPYSTEELKTFSPTSHITFEAVYGNPQNFYTVTYIDGTQSYSERVLVGSNLPAWMVSETEAYTPSKESDEKGDYVFAGWYDEKQTDTTFAATNGNKYEETSEITSNVTLYPQFKFEAKKYTITFLDYEGKKQLATYKFEYGLNIEWLIAEAQMAAKARSADETYEYEFIGWDKVVPATCEGKDMTFTAQYKATYKYYDAKWYNSKLEDGKWVADKTTLEVDGKTVETYLLDTTHHTYNSKVYAPSVKTECKVAAPDGQTYVFAGWYYKDKDGNEKAYQRGMLITAEMEFYATYTLTSKVYTVTTVVKGEETPYSVAAGNAAIIPDPQAGYVNEVLHDSFAGWYTDEEFKSEFSLDTVITSNLKLYAKFEQSLHNNSELKKVISAPTYYAAGVQEIWCSCSYENTKETVEFPALTDTVKPTGTIYLGKNKWSTSDDVGAAATDNYPVEIYANANTDIIITANDKGDVNELYNPSGSGKGIRLIRAFAFPADMVLTADSYSVAASVAENVFVDTTEELTNVANFTVRLGDFEIADLAIKTDTEGNIVYDKNGKEEYVVQYNDDGSIKTKPLVSGETYIIYYTIIDKANNQQNTKVRTAKFIYDAEGPEFTITGKKNSNEAYPTYCETATITNIEADATLAINGKAVTIEEGTNSYTITKAGNYLITVTDIAGNSVSKKIKIAAEHVYSTSEKAVICTEDGYYKEECINCGDKKTDVKYIAEGHDMGETKTVEPTCKSHGYKVTECKNCDYVDRVEYQLNTDGSYALDENGEKIPVFPAVDHDYTGAEYKVAIAPTCTTEGLEEAFCTECGEGRVTRTIEIDTSAHKLGTLKTLEATCESAGYKYRVCKLCNNTIKEAGSDVAALGHSTENENWVVTVVPTCAAAGEESLLCDNCNLAQETRTVAATGNHTYGEPVTEDNKSTYTCNVCGNQKVTEVVTASYTVTLKAVNGNVVKTLTMTSGTSLTDAIDALVAETYDSEDGRTRYTFAGWMGENGKAVALPFDVTSDVTLKAYYTEKTIVLTHNFYAYTKYKLQEAATVAEGEGRYSFTDEVKFAAMIGAKGDLDKKPTAVPTMESTDKYDFRFVCWTTRAGEEVTDFTMVDDMDFVAKFEVISKEHKVQFFNGTSLVWETIVNGGETVTFGGNLDEVTKAYDKTNHYTFSHWCANSSLTKEFDFNTEITADTKIYASFTAAEHNYDKNNGAIAQAATCTLPEKRTYTCTCGATVTEKSAGALGHELGDPVYDEATGQNIYYCVRYKACGHKISANASVKIKFVNDDGTSLGNKDVKVNETVVYEGDVPTKAQTAEEVFTFAGWVDADGNEYAADYEFTAVADATYTAYYTAKARMYTVSYVDLDRNLIATGEYAYGSPVPAAPDDKEPGKAYDDTYHYTFAGWDIAEGAIVTGELIIKPKEYNKVPHEWKDVSLGDPTCEDDGGKKSVCKCGAEKAGEQTVPALGHKWEEIPGTRVEPTLEKEGSVSYKCTNKDCNKTKTETLDKLTPKTVVITVKDSDSKAVEGARVDLYSGETWIGTAYTNENGQAIFTDDIAAGTYKVLVSGVEGAANKSFDIKVGKDGYNDKGNGAVMEKPVTTCSCSCHKAGFWGIIYRFFQKIIGFFTGGVKCCADPRT